MTITFIFKVPKKISIHIWKKQKNPKGFFQKDVESLIFFNNMLYRYLRVTINFSEGLITSVLVGALKSKCPSFRRSFSNEVKLILV